MVLNRALIFKSVPDGWPIPGKDLVVESGEFDLKQDLPVGSILVKVLYTSFDPYMRGRMRDSSVKSYSPAFQINKPIDARSICKVIRSNNSQFSENDEIVGQAPVQEWNILSGDSAGGLQKIKNPYKLDPLVYLGALGMTGLTAYSSLYEIGKPQKGETIFISAASGAVGQVVGQLSKHEGLRVIGSVGSEEKLEFIINELKFDGGFNYKVEKTEDALRSLAPNGVDIYYDNVGGEQLEAALDHMNDFGRVVVCGMISQYSKKPEERYGVKSLMNIVAKRLTIRGFLVLDKDFGPKYAEEHNRNVSKWIHDGTFVHKASITDGIENGPDGFVGMLAGKNFGKSILKIAEA
ncbi:hypothetical protein V1511DRAFT_507263 [Dipodascopsis uninucleata]